MNKMGEEKGMEAAVY